MTDTPVHCHRPLWKRPPFWFVIIATVLALGIGIAMEESARRAPMPYGAFLDQLEAGNIASVTFRGTQIDGSLKHALSDAVSNGATQKNTFRSHVPDFGDPALLAELRKQHVVIDVASSSSWTRLLAGLPWPMLLFIGVALIAGLIRLVRGGKAQSGSAMPTHPMQGMIGFVRVYLGSNSKQQSLRSTMAVGQRPAKGLSLEAGITPLALVAAFCAVQRNGRCQQWTSAGGLAVDQYQCRLNRSS